MQKLKEIIEKIVAFFKKKDTLFALMFILSFMCVIGAVNGIGYSIYIHQWPTAICLLPVIVCAVFTLVRWWKAVINK